MVNERSSTRSLHSASHHAFRVERLWGSVAGGLLLLVGLAILIARESMHHFVAAFFDQYIWWHEPMEAWRAAKLHDLIVYSGGASLAAGGLVVAVAYVAPTVLPRLLDVVLTPVTREDDSGNRRLSFLSIGLLIGSFGFAYAMNMKSLLSLSWLTFEDGLTEYTTTFAFLGAAFLSVLAAYRLRTSAYRWVSIIYIVMALGFWLVAMEEVSWGQRLLNIKPLDAIREVNSQGELNLHNMQIFRGHVDTLFMIVSAIGVLGTCVFIALKAIGRGMVTTSLLLPQPALIFPLFIVLVYTSVSEDVIGLPARRTMGETRETLAAICAFLYAVKNFGLANNVRQRST